MISQANDTFAEFRDSGDEHGRSIAAASRFFSETNVGAGQKKYSMGETISQDSAQKLKRLHTVEDTNLTQRCYIVSKREAKAYGLDLETKLAAQKFGDTCARFRNLSRAHMISLKMSSSSHLYITLTVHAFKQLICQVIGLFNNVYILHASAVDSSFVPISSVFSIEKINQTGEENQTSLQKLVNSQAPEGRYHVYSDGRFDFQKGNVSSDEFLFE